MSTIFLICQRGAAAARRRFNFGVVAAGVSLLGLVGLGYLSGASAMYFGLPSSEYLSKAFTGAEDYFSPDAPLPAPRDLTAEARAARDPLGGAFDGLILVTPAAEAEAALVDGRGTVVHRWRMPARRPGSRSPHVREPLPTEPIIWERVHLYPNGDLLALCSAKSASPYGYGLVKLDKDSKMLWWHSANAHHDLDVGDDGRIYLLTQRLDAKPPAELKLPGTYPAEEVTVLSPEGRELDVLPLYEPLRDSPHHLTFLWGREQALQHAAPAPGGSPPLPPGAPLPPGGPLPPPDQLSPDDVLHSNSVRVLSAALAPKFPLFRPGMLLVSLRTPSLLVVLDPRKRCVVWAARGPWRSQHDARFLDNGHVLLFDNSGSGEGARALEYDPVTQAIPWSFAPKQTPFFVPFRGGAQRLPNGNTLLIGHGCQLLEVTTNKDVVWQAGPPSAGPPLLHHFTDLRCCAPAELTFLR